MSHQLHNSLVRILTADGIPVGVGFLAADNLILTCAHVIKQAKLILNETERKNKWQIQNI